MNGLGFAALLALGLIVWWIYDHTDPTSGAAA